MDLHRIVFDEINEEFWGIPSGTPSRRRRGHAPRVLVAAGKAARSAAGKLVLFVRKTFTPIGTGRLPAAPTEPRGTASAARAGVSLHLVTPKHRQAMKRLDRAA